MTPAVIDTGVLVSGIYWRHEPHRCVQAWLRGLLALVVSDSIFAEYERVLREVKAEQGSPPMQSQNLKHASGPNPLRVKPPAPSRTW